MVDRDDDEKIKNSQNYRNRYVQGFKKGLKGRLVGLFHHCIRRLIVLFIHLQRRHAPHRRE